MKLIRSLAATLAVAAAGCLWLFPIEQEKSGVSTTGTAGSIDTTGTAGAAGAAGSMAPAIDAGECTQNSDCGDVSMKIICRTAMHKCVELRTDECLLVLGNWNDPNAYIFGAFATEPMGKPDVSQPVYNFELALKELNAGGGLPESQGTKRHPLAVVVCNNDPELAATDSGFYGRSLDHLVDDLGVSAIVADLAPADLTKAFESTRNKGKTVFFLSPGAANNDLYALKDDGLVWSMMGPPQDLADGYSDLVHRIEKYVGAKADAGSTPLRVATVLKDDPGEVDHQLLTELYGAVLPQLTFNARSAMSQMGSDYREFHIGTTGDAGSPAAEGDAINAFAPHIVISMTGTDFTSNGPNFPEGVVHRIMTFASAGPERQAWAAHEYPFFIGSPINAAATADYTRLLLSSIALQDRVLYQRFLGITIAGADDRDVYNEYRKRLGDYQKAASDGFENYYDSIYYLAYAIYTGGVELADANTIRVGMGSISNGPPLKVGSSEIDEDGGVVNLIEKAFQDIKKNGSALLIGAGGSEFDVTHGVRTDKAGLYCFRYNNGSTPIAFQPAEIFDSKKHVWTVFSVCSAGL